MRPLYIILLILWFIASYLLCNKYFTCTPATAAASAAETTTGAVGATMPDGDCITAITFEDQDFLVSSSENFRFSSSDESQLEPSEDFRGIISQVATYLSDNPDRFMQLTGYYLDGEENATDYDNLGIARAKSVREYLKENGFEGTQLTTNSEMLESGCVKDGVLLRGMRVKFDEIPE